jgi:hypothetical protein
MFEVNETASPGFTKSQGIKGWSLISATYLQGRRVAGYVLDPIVMLTRF